MTNPTDSLDDLGPRDPNTGLDYEAQRYAAASAAPESSEVTFNTSKCANCDEAAVYVLDRPQFETLAFCGMHIPTAYKEDAKSKVEDAEAQSRVKSTKDAPLEGVNDPEAVAKTAPVKTVQTPKPPKVGDVVDRP